MFSILVNYNDYKSEFSEIDLEGLADFVLQHENIKKNASASINFICEAEIHILNKTYRNIDSPTDVLSFECDGVDDNFESSEEFMLGDIFICPEIAIENSKKFNTSIESELKLLTVHGMLHLCGYDHMEEEEAKIMESKEDQILDAWSR